MSELREEIKEEIDAKFNEMKVEQESMEKIVETMSKVSMSPRRQAYPQTP